MTWRRPDIDEEFVSTGSGLRYRRVASRETKTVSSGWFKGKCLDQVGVGYFHASLARRPDECPWQLGAVATRPRGVMT